MIETRDALDGRLTVNLTELAKCTGHDVRTLRRWARENDMPAYRVQGAVIVIIEEYLAWLRSRPAYGASDGAALDEKIERAFGRKSDTRAPSSAQGG